MDNFFQFLGRSAGGFTTKVYVLSDGKGLGLKIILTGGEVYDRVPAIELLENFRSNLILGDKGYDS